MTQLKGGEIINMNTISSYIDAPKGTVLEYSSNSTIDYRFAFKNPHEVKAVSSLVQVSSYYTRGRGRSSTSKGNSLLVIGLL